MRKILFIHDSEKMKIDEKGNLYTDGSYSMNVWKRYIQGNDKLTVITRMDEKIYSKKYAESKFNMFDKDKINFKSIEDRNASLKSFFSKKIIKSNKEILQTAIFENDYIIVRVPNFYGLYIMNLCHKMNKKVLVEVVGCPFDSLWNHSMKGKILSIINYFRLKKVMRMSKFSVYVTSKFLQKRYPSSGKTYSISDVDIPEINSKVLKKRINKIENMDLKKIRIGTLGSIDAYFKGQKYVIKAIPKLKSLGIEVQYELVGGECGTNLTNLSKKLKISENVIFKGTMTHDKIFEWIDSLDYYIQPSLTEGLPRSIIEAMSRGCPIFGSDAGGIPELIDKKCIFKRKSVNQIVELIQKNDKEKLIEIARNNFKNSSKYETDTLNILRKKIYSDFFNS